MSNPYEDRGRYRKTVALCDYLERNGFSEEMLRNLPEMPEEWWAALSRLAQVANPPSEETKRAVVERLTERMKGRAA